MITFKKVKDAYGWLSNMSPHPIDEWRTAEHLFQALRFPPDCFVAELIKAEKSPMGAKMVAKKHLGTVELSHQPRSIEDVNVMIGVLMLKVKRNPELAKLLIDTGDEELVEDVTNRPNESGLFWGAALQNGQWVGRNHLGWCWMVVRDGYAKRYA
jgi:ribA/ribD-fused uncharacterized protein